ncbi:MULTISPECIES: hypothetical protein [Streptomyces]|uniref:Basic proline-rich protein-like n=1 Tax=Streptomyces ramulosus TaxID=47762 RepID=A0ABW1FGM4_9ACTN
MPEMPERTPAASGDYLGRLLARYAPAPPADPFGPPGGAEGPGRRTLVRPRLPGPFERVEALGGPAGGDVADDGLPSPRAPGRPAPAPFAGQPPRGEHRTELRTRHERETVIRTEAAPEAGRGPAGRRPGPAPLLRPAATAVPGARAAGGEGVRPRGRASGAEGPAGSREAAPWDAGGAGPAPSSGALRPRADAPAAPRAPAPPRTAAAAGRRGSRGPAERVVHVQIGRLEVSAAGAEGPAAGGRPPRPERRAPAMNLADYLASRQRTSGGRSQ